MAQETVATKAHDLTKVEATAAAYFAAGSAEHYTCVSCAKLFADVQGGTEVTAADITIAQQVKIEETTADVSTKVIDTVIKDAVVTGTTDIVITVATDGLDVTEDEDNPPSATPDSSTAEPAPQPVVTKTQLPVAAVEQVAEFHEEATLTINMTNATVTLDKTTLDAVTKKAKSEQSDVVSLEVEHIEPEMLAPAQQKAVETQNVAAVIFLHNAQNCFGISMYLLRFFQPLPHAAISASLIAFLLLLTDGGGKLCIMGRLLQTSDIQFLI